MGPLFRQSMTFSNHSEAPVELRIEPWGDVVMVGSRAAVVIAVVSEREGALDVVYGPQPAVWAWDRCTAEIRQGGRVILSLSVRTP